VSSSDLPWLWASYRRGDWPETLLAGGVEQGEFRAAVERLVAAFAVFELLVAPTAEGSTPLGPVGVALGHASDHRIEAHFLWFDWATARNRLECGVKFFRLAADEHIAIVYAEESDEGYFDRVCRYGSLKRRATVPGFFSRSRPAILYTTRTRDT